MSETSNIRHEQALALGFSNAQEMDEHADWARNQEAHRAAVAATLREVMARYDEARAAAERAGNFDESAFHAWFSAQAGVPA